MTNVSFLISMRRCRRAFFLYFFFVLIIHLPEKTEGRPPSELPNNEEERERSEEKLRLLLFQFSLYKESHKRISAPARSSAALRWGTDNAGAT